MFQTLRKLNLILRTLEKYGFVFFKNWNASSISAWILDLHVAQATTMCSISFSDHERDFYQLSKGFAKCPRAGNGSHFKAHLCLYLPTLEPSLSFSPNIKVGKVEELRDFWGSNCWWMRGRGSQSIQLCESGSTSSIHQSPFQLDYFHGKEICDLFICQVLLTLRGFQCHSR